MLKSTVALFIVLAGTMAASRQADAHFSQVFTPFKAQLVAVDASVAEVKMTCAGHFVETIETGWFDRQAD